MRDNERGYDEVPSQVAVLIDIKALERCTYLSQSPCSEEQEIGPLASGRHNDGVVWVLRTHRDS